MTRCKINKEYAIKITHPEFGEYYFSYTNNNGYYSNHNNLSYIFTKNLNKVTTWKTIKYAEKEIFQIMENINKYRSNIKLLIGTEVNEEIKSRLILSRKKYYFIVNSVSSQSIIDRSNRLNETILEDSKNITESIKKNSHIDKNFMEILKKFEKDINSFREDYNFLQKIKTNDVNLDIVDASYGFRRLKLKTLNMFQDDNEDEALVEDE